MEYRVDRETAEQELERFYDEMEIDTDKTKMDDEDVKSFNNAVNNLTKSIMLGALTIGETGEPTFVPRRSDDKTPITFREPTGACLMSTDKKGKGKDVSKTFTAMAEMTGQPAKRFALLKQKDVQICLDIFVLFMD